MTDRYRRAQQRRRFFHRVWFFFAAVVLLRFFGPSVFLIQTSSISPVLQDGDVVYTRHFRQQPARGSIIVLPPTLASPSLLDRALRSVARLDTATTDTGVMPRRVIRLVVATEGDQITWNDRLIVVRSRNGEEEITRYDLEPIDRDLTLPLRQMKVPADQVFAIAVQPGRIDSRMTGPITLRGRVYVAGRILLPFDRARSFTDQPVDIKELTYGI